MRRQLKPAERRRLGRFSLLGDADPATIGAAALHDPQILYLKQRLPWPSRLPVVRRADLEAIPRSKAIKALPFRQQVRRKTVLTAIGLAVPLFCLATSAEGRNSPDREEWRRFSGRWLLLQVG